MALSTDVTIPSDIKAVFPEKCVVCSESTHDTSKITVDTSNFLLSFFLPLLTLFGWKRIEFPLCVDCKLKFFIQRWTREFLIWLTIIVVIFIGWPYLKEWNRHVAKWILLGLGILVLVPYFVYEAFFPRWFDATAGPKKTSYEFKSSDYAYEFYMLNDELHEHAEIEIE